jgi:photosystem II stability/assembly factor-like uncharacterized protein
MRSPQDEEPGGTLAVPPAGQPGGKVLQRLHQFEQERSFQPTAAVETAAEPPLGYNPPEGAPPAVFGAAALPRGRRRRVGGNRFPDTSPYLDAFRQMQQMPAARAVTGLQPAWTPLGPFAIPHGQTYGAGPGSRPSVSGRVSALAVDPTDDSHVLAGSAAGGVWETRDAGRTWRPRTDDQPTLTIGALAFDPTDPRIAYAGTGEGNFYRRLGAGLLRSDDGGTTWTLRATSPFVGLGFYDLIVDPLNGNHLLAATTGNLAESFDGGATWAVRRVQIVWSLSMHPAVAGDPSSTKEVFAACGDGLQRSADGGATWSAVALPGAPPWYSRLAVCHAPTDGGVVYVFGESGGRAYLWRRDTHGGAFGAIAPPGDLATGQAWYDWYVAVPPGSPDTVYLGAINLHKGTRSGAAWSWENISARASGDSIHPDQHAIAFSATNGNRIYTGNDGGVYRSLDAGGSWQSLNTGLCITEFVYLAQHPAYDAWLLGGTQDNGTLRYEGCELWPHVADGDGGDCGVNASAPYTCYHTYYGMGMERSASGGGWGTFTWIGPNVPQGYGALFYPPLEVNNSVVAQAGRSVFISTDDGATWREIALPQNVDVASALAIPTPARVLVGTASGEIFRIDQASGGWGAAVALAQPRAGYVSDLFADPAAPNRLWATYSTLTGGHVYRSDDGGASWVDVSAGLPDIPANAIVVDPAAPDTVYVAMDLGVYRSNDAGATWARFGVGLPNAIVGELLFHPSARLLRAGTRSRGVWEIAVDQGTTPAVEVYLRDSVVDTARRVPSASGGPDPFAPGGVAAWWDSADIKIDGAPLQRAGQIDYVTFGDDRGVFAAGLQNRALRGPSRVHVLVRNRGASPATNVAVRLFYVDAAQYQPLPAGFWANFLNNTPTGAWKAVGPPQIIPTLERGWPQVASFDWNAPGGTSGVVWLLATVTADNDPLAVTELNPGLLVPGSPKCALKKALVLPYARTQFRGTVPARGTQRWYTFNWPAAWHVVWTVVPATPRPGAPQVRWQVQVERAAAEFVTYWLIVTNLTDAPVEIEGRYAILSLA